MTKNVGLICPHCGEPTNGTVTDSREIYLGRRRRRICEHCGQRYSTIESCVMTGRQFLLYQQNGGVTDANKQT